MELLKDLENTDDDGLKTKKKTAGDELGAHQSCWVLKIYGI